MSERGLNRLRDERGSALVVAILVTVMLLALGLGTLAFADNQSRQGGAERIQESTFNLTEAAMRQQLFLVSKSWPSSMASAYPGCTQETAASVTRCPNDSALRASYRENDPSNRDYSAGYSWETRVQDNGGTVTQYYRSAGASGQPGWDQSGPNGIPDGKVWVRASSTVRGRTRTVVTLVSVSRVPLSSFPRKVVTGGYFATGNKGKKVIVDTQGPNGQPSGVQVRCPPPSGASCLDYPPGKGQVSPENVTTGYTGGNGMTDDELNGLRGIARQNGTYYASGCPSGLTGKVVFVENGNCSYNGGSYNSAATPGTVVVATGTLSLGGNAGFFGLVYGANKQGTTGVVVSTGGTACIRGAVTVDGMGGVRIGSSGKVKGCGGLEGNLVWDSSAIDQLETYGQATPLDGTWRELCVRQTDGTDCPSS